MIGRTGNPGKKKGRRRDAGGQRGSVAALLLSTSALVGVATPSFGADTTWTGATGTDWSVNTNWNTNNVPTNADNVFINTDQGSGNFPIINANAVAAHISISNNAAGFLGINNATLAATSMEIGDGVPNTIGLLEVVNNGAVTLTGSLMVGNASRGSASFSGGADLTVGGDAFVGFGNFAGENTLTFSGAGTTGTFTNSLTVGNGNNNSSGILTINTGADVGALNLFLGAQLSSTGTVNIDGSGSTLDIAGFLTVGEMGTGALNISNQAAVTVAAGNVATVGSIAGSNGTVTVSGDGSLTTGSVFIVGLGGAGTLNVLSGGDVVTSQLYLGDSAGGTGTAAVTGAGSTVDVTSVANVGGAGTGILTISAGGLVNITNDLRIGRDAGSAGTTTLTGAGSMLKVGDALTVGDAGTGTLTIAGAAAVSINTGTGTLTIGSQAGSSGTVNIGAAAIDPAAAAGTLAANTVAFGAGNGLLVFNHTDTTYGFNGNITGAGTILHRAGVTLLTGSNNAFTGTTVITGGSLYVNDTLGGTVNVNGGTLGGSGTLTGAFAVNAGGTLAPGNSIGTLNVGNITINAGSTYTVELNDGGFVAGTNNDLVNATGTATINGGTVNVTPVNGADTGTTYTLGTYTILTAAGGVAGTFDTLTDDYAFLDFALSYDASNVFLTSSLAATTFCLAGMTSNECAAGNGVFSVGSGSLYTAVLNLSNAEAPGALDQLSGEVHASARTALVEDSRFVREAALSRLRVALGGVGANTAAQAEQKISDRFAFWGQGFGSRGHWESNGNAAKMNRDAGGFFLGGDAALTDNARFGLMGGYGRTSFSVAGRSSAGDADTATFGAYGGGQWNAFSLTGGLAHSWHSLSTSRSVAFTGLSDSLSVSYSARTLQAYGEASYGIRAGRARFEPFANLAYVNLSTDGFTESGGAAVLMAASQNVKATFATVGLRAETNMKLGKMDAMLRGLLGWRHAFGDMPASTLTFAAGGNAFTVAGVPIARDALVLGAGLDVDVGRNTALGISYGGQFGSGALDHSAKANFNVRF